MSADGVPHVVKRFKVVVGRGIIADLTPDTLLSVEARLIRREVLEVHIVMHRQKGAYFIAPVPHGAIDKQPDRVATECTPKVTQDGQKALVGAMGVAQQATTPQQRRDPAEDIEALPMGTAGGHPEALAAFRPTSTQAGVQREARLVFEDNGFVRAQCGESFFRLSRNCRASSARACT